MSRFREQKTVEFKVVQKPKALNENAQVGDKVVYDGQRGYIIGQAQNGDWLVQVQGTSQFVSPKDVKVMGVKAKTMELPYKFDEKTQKVLFEQFVKCGIFMGNTPIRTTNCFVKYSQWRDANMNENVNVMADGELNIMPKENVRVFEDPNDFANPADYVDGVEIDEASGDAISNILVNAIDYTQGLGDADPIRVIRNPESQDPQLDTLPKAKVRTLAV